MRQSLILIALIVSFAAYSKPRVALPPPVMQGQAVVFAGTAYTYSYTESFIVAPMWSIHSGTATINSTWSSGDTYYASITWTTSGRVDFFDEVEGAHVYKVVTVLAPPTAPTGYTCGSDTVRLTATIGAGGTGVRWYTDATGGTLLGSSPTYKRYITSNSTYYVETWNSTYSMASSRISVNAIKGTIPASPTSITNAVGCGDGPVSLSAVPGSGGNSIQWYSSPTGGAVAHTGLTFTTPSLTSSIGYYVASYDSITGCFSAGRSEVVAEIYAVPPPLVAWGNPIRYGSGQTALNAISYTVDRFGEMLNSEIDLDVYDVFWYSTQTNAENDVSRLANALTYTTDVLTASTTYYARIQDEESGCYSNIASVIAEVVPYVTNASVRTDLVRVTGKKTEASLTTLTDAEKTTTFAYLDGVGRVQQSVVLRGSPTGKDIVMPAEYDATGRVSRQYLAYVASTTNGSFHSGYKAEQKAFYLAPSDKIADDSSAYVKTVYEASPLGRVLEQGSAGKAYQPGTTHTTRAEYAFNIANEVRRLDKKGNSTGFYAAKTLTKVKSISAQNNHIITFIDGSGRTILTRQQIAADVEGVYTDYLETYYVYNDLGQVNFIISPKGVAELKSGSWNFTQVIKDSLSNQFRYDNKGRVIEKKVPGQAWQYIVYDPLGRIVLTQDGLLRTSNKWMFIKYDYKGNAVMTGLHTNTTYTTRATMQTYVDGIYVSGHATFGVDTWYEKQGTTLEGYTSQSFPNANLEVLSVNYFDDYDFDNNSSADAAYISAGTVFQGQHTATSLIHNRPTGSKKIILGTSTWLKTYIFYDDRGRIIQVQSTNPLNTSSMDRVTNAYADDGRVLYTRKFHNGPDTINVLNKYQYTTRGDLEKVSQAHRGNSYQLVALYEYNELGQLVDKKLHNTGGSNYLQSVDYRYTINGQLKSINNSELSSNGSNDETNDYFGMELLYDDTESGLTTTQRYDGMVSAIKWKGAGGASGTTGQKSYVLTYDKTGRLETAGYRSNETAWDKEVGAQNETMSYDHNGNIKTLTRAQRKHQLSGIIASYTSETIDNLTYEYASSNKNSLKKVTDAAGDAAAIGFDNGTSSTNNDYKYDANGNLLKDANKGITNIVYNFLGKPTQVNFADNRKIEYVYDAGGNKLTQKLYNGATLITTTEYVNGFVYEKTGAGGSNVLTFFGSPEGRVVKNGSSLQYEYSIADHQGNTRVVFTSATLTPAVPQTGFETETSGDFISSSYTHRSTLAEMNRTPSGTYSQLLHGGYNSQVGAATTIHVYPGDTIKAEVYAKYRNATSTAGNLTSFAGALALAFEVSSSSVGEALNAYTGINNYGSVLASGSRPNDNDAVPKGFVTIMLFDKHHNFLNAAWDQMGDFQQTSTPPAKDPFDKLFQKMIVREEGYAYIFVSNENPTKVDIHFDDLKVTHVKSNVIQNNEYYPFGLQTSTSWTRESTRDNQALYNAGSELNKANGWYEMYYRGYDPAIARMLQVDPYAPLYASSTTYNYALNNPVMMNDPSGGQTAEYNYGVSDYGVHRYNMIWNRNDPNLMQGYYDSFFAWADDQYAKSQGEGGSGGSRTIKDDNGNIIGYGFSGATARFVFGVFQSGFDQGFNTTSDGQISVNIFFSKNAVLYADAKGRLYAKTEAEQRVDAAKLVIANYKAHLTKYSQANRKMGLDVDYADCSSTLKTILEQAGQADKLKGTYTAAMREEIAAQAKNNTYRFDSPLAGDIMMWGGHVAMVTEVTDSKIYFATMGRSGASIANVKLDSNGSLLTESVYGGGGFKGFWTPD